MNTGVGCHFLLLGDFFNSKLYEMFVYFEN